MTAFPPDDLAAQAERFLDEVPASPAVEPFTYPSCAHCGLEIEDRGDPNPFGPWEIR